VVFQQAQIFRYVSFGCGLEQVEVEKLTARDRGISGEPFSAENKQANQRSKHETTSHHRPCSRSLHRPTRPRGSFGRPADERRQRTRLFTNDPAAGKWDDRSETEAEAATTYAIAEVVPGPASQVAIFPAVEIAWTTQTRNSYQLQRSSLANTNNWFSLGAPIQGNGSTNYYPDSTRGEDKRFYRVLTLPTGL
jgi:hypothetical protein